MDDHLFTGNSRDGIASSLDLRPEVFDDDGGEEGTHEKRRVKLET
jgi:hypothetical protein